MKNKSSLPTHVPKHMVGMFLVFGAAVVLAVLVAGCWMWRSEVPQRLNRLPNPATLPQMPEAPPYQTTAEPVPEVVPQAPAPEMKQDLREEVLDISWETPKVFAVKDVYGAVFDIRPYEDGFSAEMTETFMYRGKVKSGSFKGSELYYYNGCHDMGCGESRGAFLLDRAQKQLYVLGIGDGCYLGCVYGVPSDLYESMVPEIIVLPNVTFALAKAPASTLVLPDGKLIKLQYRLDTTSVPLSSDWSFGCNDVRCIEMKDDYYNYQLQGVAKDGTKIWRSSSEGCLYVFTASGERYAYASTLSSEDLNKATWMDAYKDSSLRTYISRQSTGCGPSRCADVVPASQVKISDYKVIGRTQSGDSLYTPRNLENNELAQLVYDGTYELDENGDKISLSAFFKKYPVPFFLWKDAFGDYVRFTSQDLQPAAECGKPVIYLYPPKTTNVSVKLGSNINVTVSEPTYPARGWNVVAQPNGDLLYQGQTYGSLFWEGTGVGYEVPKTGFLIKDGQVDQQLKVILAKYGLNEKESAEFREFWVPKMTGAKYYRVSFVETAAWNKAAPLAVSPRPTSVLRIFMDWQKLSAPIQIQEPKIQPFVRDGFTLVEWGGLLRK